MSSSQIGHSMSVGSLADCAARCSSGWASHTSCRASRPLRYSDTTAHAGQAVVDDAARGLLPVPTDRLGPERHAAEATACRPAARVPHRRRPVTGRHGRTSPRLTMRRPSSILSLHRIDTSARCSDAPTHDRPRHPRPAHRAGAPRLRAEEAARRAARRPRLVASARCTRRSPASRRRARSRPSRSAPPCPPAPMTGSLAGELAAFRARVRESGLVKGTGRGKKVYGITDVGPRAPRRAPLRPRRQRRPHLHPAGRLLPPPRPGRPPRAVRAPPHRAARPPRRPARAAAPAAAPTPTSARSSSATPTTSPTTSPGSTA